MKNPQVSEKTAGAILRHYFGEDPESLSQIHGGLANFVFEAAVKGEGLIIRISDDPARLPFFLKEQWVVNKLRDRKVPVAKILEVGNEVGGLPYMILDKVEGEPATNHQDRCRILRQVAEYAREINSIPTSDFGHIFDWSRNHLSRNKTWGDYLESELKVRERLEFYGEQNLLSPENLNKLELAIEDLRGMKQKPTLNHGDIRLKNVILNQRGEIQALIDWEDCTSNLAPFWELSIALHDLNMDEREAFLDGYGLKPERFEEIVPVVRALNLLNYFTTAREVIKRKDRNALDWLKVRLNGHLDLHSL